MVFEVQLRTSSIIFWILVVEPASSSGSRRSLCLSELVANWTKKLKLNISTEKQAFEYRDKFIEDHEQELFNDAVTLCHQHHQKLHSIYGRNPKLVTGPKQRRWVELQREKYGLV